MRTLSDIGERDMILRFGAIFSSDDSVITGIGDDAAVIRVTPDSETDLVLTTDAVIDGVHFKDAKPAAIGHKAVARTLSDLAAMGAQPRWALVDCTAPHDTPAADLEEVARAMQSTASKYGMVIIGGDTSEGPCLALHVCAIGELPHGTAILRSGAQPGDCIYVTGLLGGSLKGRHLSFTPRITESLWLRKRGCVTAMIDMSDGLAVDLAHICDESQAAAAIEISSIPVSPDAEADGPLFHAVGDGEDYELLFTVPPDSAKELESAWRDTFDVPLTRIGVMKAGEPVMEVLDADGTPVDLGTAGHEHFSG